MQNMAFFLSRDNAKLVPIDNVAGNAGGTTIVIKSKARIMIKCQASCLLSAGEKKEVFESLYLESDEIDERRDKAQPCNSSHNGYISEGIFVKFEA